MAITAPPTITPLPTPPDPNDRSTFNSRAYPWSVALQPFSTELTAVANNVHTNALDAEDQAGIATAQADIATNKAAEALGHANTASGAATTAVNVLDAFDDRYLGAKSSPPSTDNDGNALTVGALYFLTSGPNPGFRVWDGAAWVEPVGSISPDFSIVREVQTAAGGQTIFDLTNSYSVGTNSIMVYRNGLRLNNTEYTETNSRRITLATGATAGDKLLFEIGVVSTGTSVAAGNVTFNPSGNITATNVQAAIQEVASRETTPSFLLMSQGVI
jgi:hypothetical protein